MKMKKILQSALLLSAGFIGSAQAVSVGLNTDETNVHFGETVSIGINFDFTGGNVVGGNFRVNYDADILNNPVFTFDDSSKLDVFGIESGANDAQQRVEGALDIAFGRLSFTESVTGAGHLGYLTFDTLAEGSSDIRLEDLFGGFFDVGTGEQVPIDYQNGSVNVSSVPVPASVWLFASAFGLLVGRRKTLNNKLLAS
jgi:hypothetical protein